MTDNREGERPSAGKAPALSVSKAALTGALHTSVTAFRYAAQLAALPECPDDATAPFSALAFHVVHNPTNADDFLPKALRWPDSLEVAAGDSKKCCKMWGLSMFESEEQLRKHVLQVEKSVKTFRELVGEYAAHLKLTSTLGKRTKPNAKGHFTFHEYVGFDAGTATVEVKPLFP
jgi:hypothetical protein